MPKCPNDHDSTWEDFCSVCGEAISASAGGPGADPSSPATPAAAAGDAGDPGASAVGEAVGAKNTAESIGLSCPNCSVSRTEFDVFCESCGYDFASGTLPTEESSDSGDGPDPASGTPDAANAAVGAAVATGAGATTFAASGPSSASAPETSSAPAGEPSEGSAPAPSDTVAVVSLDREFFDRVAGGGELQYPDPEPLEARIALVGNEILIGRRSDSRGIYPEIDLSPPMDDPAVSHRHAMLRRGADGDWTVTDLDSTNGTYLGDHTVSMVPGKEKPLPIGTALFVGAYTKVILEPL